MSVISNLPAMANRIAYACEYLHFLGPDGDLLSDVERQLSPLRAENEDGIQGSTIAKDLINEMEKLKLITVNNQDKCSLGEDVRDVAPRDGDWMNALRPLMLQRLTFPESAELHKQNEVPDALSWLLNQNSYDPLPKSGGTHAQRIDIQLGSADPLRTAIANDSRFQNLQYWAKYLGLAEWVGLKSTSIVIPDPTRAIEILCPRLFVESTELQIGVFLQKLAFLCPVLDGGTARRTLEERLVNGLQREEGHLSTSLSLALKRLELRGLIKIISVSDARTWVLDYGTKKSPVSGIRFNGKVAA